MVQVQIHFFWDVILCRWLYSFRRYYTILWTIRDLTSSNRAQHSRRI